MTRAMVFDATPLIYLVRISLANVLVKLSVPKFLSQDVYDEILKGENLGKPESSVVRELVETGKLQVRTPQDPSFASRLIGLTAGDDRKPLHRAEAEALTLAKELKGILISDDRVARSAAKLVDVELHGTGYLLGRMYRDGYMSKQEAATKLSEMRRAGWRLSEDDYRAVSEYLSNL